MPDNSMPSVFNLEIICCPKEIPKEQIGIWSIFRECTSSLTTQATPELLISLFNYVCADDKKYDHTDFYRFHSEAIWIVKEFRTVFQKHVNISDANYNHLGEKQVDALIDKIKHETTGRLYCLVERLIPGLNVDFITALSGEVYENKQVGKQTLVVLPSADSLNKDPGVIVFDECSRIELTYSNVHAIRKQLQMCKDESLLAVARTEKGFKTIGIAPFDVRKKYPFFIFNRHMEWNLNIPIPNRKGDVQPPLLDEENSYKQQDDKMCLIRCLNGNLMLPTMNLKLEFSNIVDRIFGIGGLADKIGIVLNEVTKIRCGAVFIISNEEKINDECDRLVNKNHRGIMLSDKIDLTSCNGVAAIRKLVSIDGAIMVDINGYCHAFGVILDGQAVIGTSARGARYNCTKSYIASHEGMMGVVLSEDGMIDCFPEVAMYDKNEFDVI